MVRPSILLVFFVAVGFAQSSQSRHARVDSLVDVFPLAIGNEWNYGYNYRFDDYGGVIYLYKDTGSVNLRVMNKVVAPDSTRWLIREIGNHWILFNEPPWTGPHVRIDTFEVIEFSSGNHRLYRPGDPRIIRESVLPFVSTLADTARVYRYTLVDTNGNMSFKTREAPMGVFFTFRFSCGVGLASVWMYNGITGWPSFYTDHVLRSSIITDFNSHGTQRPQNYCLKQNYPNPFNPGTTIEFSVPMQSNVSLKLFDILGKEIVTIVAGEMEAGDHSMRFDASGLASGVYFYKLTAGSFVQVKKMVLAK